MKIYNKVVIDIATGEVIEEDSYEYTGEICHLGGGKVEVPGPTPQETALQQQQLEMLKWQQSMLQDMVHQQDLLSPILYKQMGITPQYDNNGKIIGYDVAPNDLIDTNKQIAQLNADKTLAALQGNAPVDPALEDNLAKQETQLRGMLSKQLGPGYETSSAGIEQLSNFNKKAEELRSAARHGQLSLYEQLGLSQQASMDNSLNNFFNRSVSLSSLPMQGISGVNGFMQGSNMAMQPYLQRAGFGLQAGIQNAQSPWTSMFGNLLQGVGSGLGMGLGAYLLA